MRVLAARYLTVVDSEPLFSLEIYACGGMYAGKEVGPSFLPGLTPMLVLCPVTCRCKAGDYGCPHSCPVTASPRTPEQIEQLAYSAP